nr:hypothetical protein [uncultured Actinotalea sp.]
MFTMTRHDDRTAALLEETRADVRAVAAVTGAVAAARTTEDVVEAALTGVRREFGWAYGS